MDTSGHLPVSETAAKRVRKGRAPAPKNSVRRPKRTAEKTSNLPSVGTLARTKSLLLAALRVWELKQRVSVE